MEITKILIDFDGVLTDGKIYYTHNGEQFKGINTRDVRAIRELISNGYDVVILTASSWPGSKTFAKKTGSEIVISKDKKLFAEQLNEKFIAVGDDVWDLGLIEKSERFFAPKDCDRAIRYNSNKVEILNSKGGEGVIAELVHCLLNKN